MAGWLVCLSNSLILEYQVWLKTAKQVVLGEQMYWCAVVAANPRNVTFKAMYDTLRPRTKLENIKDLKV